MHFEQEARAGDFAWWRGLLLGIFGTIFMASGYFESISVCLTGVLPTVAAQTSGLMCCAIMPFITGSVVGAADIMGIVIGGTIASIICAGLGYFQTQGIQPQRQFKHCLLWTLAQWTCTAGTTVIMTIIVFLYVFLLSQGQTLAATLLLPSATALAETGLIKFASKSYEKFVLSKRPAFPGDISHTSLPLMFVGAHGLAEGVRLVGLLSGAIRTEGGSALNLKT